MLIVAEKDSRINGEAEKLELEIEDKFADNLFNLREKLKGKMSDTSTEGIECYKEVIKELEQYDCIDTLDLFEVLMNHASQNIKDLLPNKE